MNFFKTEELSLKEKWEKAMLANNLIFCKLMESEPDLCKHLLEILLQIKIDRLEKPQCEKSQKEGLLSKGVRFDVYTRDSSRIFDIEIQTANKDDLSKRARYYQGIIDVDSLGMGCFYEQLKESYVIFLCMFDKFKRNLPIYTFENICSENKDIKLNDRAYKIFFNIKMYDKLKNEDAKRFFKFLFSGKTADSFTRTLEEKVKHIKSNIKWRKEYMTWEQSILEAKYEAYHEAYNEASKKKAIENARKLLTLNKLSMEEIADCCGLTLEEVRALKACHPQETKTSPEK